MIRPLMSCALLFSHNRSAPSYSREYEVRPPYPRTTQRSGRERRGRATKWSGCSALARDVAKWSLRGRSGPGPLVNPGAPAHEQGNGRKKRPLMPPALLFSQVRSASPVTRRETSEAFRAGEDEQRSGANTSHKAGAAERSLRGRSGRISAATRLKEQSAAREDEAERNPRRRSDDLYIGKF